MYGLEGFLLDLVQRSLIQEEELDADGVGEEDDDALD